MSASNHVDHGDEAGRHLVGPSGVLRLDKQEERGAATIDCKRVGRSKSFVDNPALIPCRPKDHLPSKLGSGGNSAYHDGS